MLGLSNSFGKNNSDKMTMVLQASAFLDRGPGSGDEQWESKIFVPNSYHIVSVG
jgi:hypothetical protein